MIGRTNAGGAGIKFKVIGGAEKPETGRENLVFVKTETAITGWVVSQKEPENLTDGMVWIKSYGESNKINLLRKNSVEVFLSNCSQRIDGKMKNVEAYLWKDNAWVQFSSERIYLIKDGKIVDGVTFTNLRKPWSSETTNIQDMAVTQTANAVRFQVNDMGGGANASCKSPEYDFTGISKLCFSATTYKPYGSGSITAIGFGNPTYVNQMNPLLIIATGDNQSLDVSNVTGTQSFTIAIHTPNTYIDFSNLWLE